MQKQLSTATPDVASLLASGYLMETPIPDPPPPIDPPDNQGGGNLIDPPDNQGGGNLGSDPEEEAPSQ